MSAASEFARAEKGVSLNKKWAGEGLQDGGSTPEPTSIGWSYILPERVRGSREWASAQTS